MKDILERADFLLGKAIETIEKYERTAYIQNVSYKYQMINLQNEIRDRIQFLFSKEILKWIFLFFSKFPNISSS